MALRPPYFIGRLFSGVRDIEVLERALIALRDNLRSDHGFFASDNLITWERCLGFIKFDHAFVDAVNRHAETPVDRGVLWRRHTLVWAARQAAPLDGDFVECACYRGVTARIIADIVGFEGGRRYFLYDLFEHDPSMPHHQMADHGEGLFESVRRRFPEPEVVITKGWVPDSFREAAPEKVAFAHIDLNNREAEIAALEFLWPRLCPGGVVVLDDYGWLAYHKQHIAEREWFAERGYPVLELPTGQGLVVKRA